MITLGNLTRFMRGHSCIGKRPFGTYADAEREIGRLLRKNASRPEQGTLAPYLCPACRSWHLGHFKDKEKSDGKQ